MDKTYAVRQYRPAYFSGFENQVVYGVPYDQITSVPWCDNFKNNGLEFDRLTVSPYSDELIIEAHYKDGKHLVVGFALSEDSEAMSNNGDKLIDNWRYKPHTMG